MPPIVLEHATLLDGTANQCRDGYRVVVEGDRIREVSDTPVTLQNAQRIDLGGKTLMPGLIDAHVHLIATSLNLGNLVNEPASLTTARALRIAEGMLQRGFTVLALPIRQRCLAPRQASSAVLLAGCQPPVSERHPEIAGASKSPVQAVHRPILRLPDKGERGPTPRDAAAVAGITATPDDKLAIRSGHDPKSARCDDLRVNARACLPLLRWRRSQARAATRHIDESHMPAAETTPIEQQTAPRRHKPHRLEKPETRAWEQMARH